MEKQIWKRARTLSFWEDYSRWYRQWMDHTDYHDCIINAVTSMAKPKWRVLDIGAGNGILSRPLAGKGCEVTAMEPSPAMRGLLREEIKAEDAQAVSIDRRSWEAASCGTLRDYDLILACNSLHLSQIGFRPALAKIFATRPEYVMVVTEFFSPDIRIPFRSGGYQLQYGRVEKMNSAFAYHSVEEAIAHWCANNGRQPDTREEEQIKKNLVRVGDHLWMDDSALVGVFFWCAVR